MINHLHTHAFEATDGKKYLKTFFSAPITSKQYLFPIKLSMEGAAKKNPFFNLIKLEGKTYIDLKDKDLQNEIVLNR